MTKKTKEAFLWIIKILRKNKIPYQISGGLAARSYGSKRPLADIDIEIHDKDFKKILPYLKNYALNGPINYKDSEFDIYGLFLEYKEQKIDICGADTQKLFNKKKKKWETEKINLSKAVTKRSYGLFVKFIPLKSLIDYKKRISRKVDIEDLKQLAKD